MQFFILNCFRSLFSWLSASSSTLLMLAGVRALRHCVDDHLPAIIRTAWYYWSCHFFLFKHFILSNLIVCVCIVWKHLPQTCCSVTFADSQTFYQRFVFNGKIHSLQARKYDVSMTSSVAKNVSLFYQWNTCFILNIPWKFCENLSIFHWNIKHNVSGCFLNTM